MIADRDGQQVPPLRCASVGMTKFKSGLLDEGEEVGVARDAPLAVGAAAEGGESVAGVFDGFAAFDGGEVDFEEIPADGEVTV